MNIFADPTPEELMGFVPQRQAAKKASAHLREPDQKTSLAIDRAEVQNQTQDGSRSPKKSPAGAKGRGGKKVRKRNAPMAMILEPITEADVRLSSIRGRKEVQLGRDSMARKLFFHLISSHKQIC